MYQLNIENPAIAKLAKEVFEDSHNLIDAEFLSFLQHQKIKSDLQKSIQEAKNGEVMSIDEAFDGVYRELDL